MPYRLRNTRDNDIAQEWNGVPKRVVFPNGDAVHAISPGHEHDGFVFEAFERPAKAETPRAITADDVARERERRLALGFDYDFGKDDAKKRGVHRIGTTPVDLAGWDEVSKYAGALMDLGEVETEISIATDTGVITVIAPEWRAIEVAAAEFRQPIWAASFVLQAYPEIPADYANDKHWPR